MLLFALMSQLLTLLEYIIKKKERKKERKKKKKAHSSIYAYSWHLVLCLLLFSSEGRVYFSTPWISMKHVRCFDQKNVVGWCRSSEPGHAEALRLLFSSSGSAVQKPSCEEAQSGLLKDGRNVWSRLKTSQLKLPKPTSQPPAPSTLLTIMYKYAFYYNSKMGEPKGGYK